MRDKLKHERKALQNYIDSNSIDATVDMIETPYDDVCLGFTYQNKKGELVYIFYHAPSLCFCINVNGSDTREISLIYEDDSEF